MPADIFNSLKEGRRGFSLLELTVTVTLTAVAAVSLSGIFYQVWQIYGDGRNDPQSGMLQSVEIMTRDLENMTPFSYARHEKVYGSGGENRLRFVRNTGNGLKMIEYTFEPRDTDETVFDFRRRESRPHPEDSGEEYALVEKVRGGFRYFFFKEGSLLAASRWEKGIPAGVEVMLSGGEGAETIVKTIQIPARE